MGPNRRPSKPKRSSKAKDEPQSSQTKPSTNLTSRSKNNKTASSKTPMDVSKMSSKNENDDGGERVYCICRKKYRPEDVMICCDNCEEWYHVDCVNLSAEEANSLSSYHCPACSPDPTPNEEPDSDGDICPVCDSECTCTPNVKTKPPKSSSAKHSKAKSPPKVIEPSAQLLTPKRASQPQKADKTVPGNRNYSFSSDSSLSSVYSEDDDTDDIFFSDDESLLEYETRQIQLEGMNTDEEENDENLHSLTYPLNDAGYISGDEMDTVGVLILDPNEALGVWSTEEDEDSPSPLIGSYSPDIRRYNDRFSGDLQNLRNRKECKRRQRRSSRHDPLEQPSIKYEIRTTAQEFSPQQPNSQHEKKISPAILQSYLASKGINITLQHAIQLSESLAANKLKESKDLFEKKQQDLFINSLDSVPEDELSDDEKDEDDQIFLEDYMFVKPSNDDDVHEPQIAPSPWDKIPITTYRRARRNSKPLLKLSSAVRSSFGVVPRTIHETLLASTEKPVKPYPQRRATVGCLPTAAQRKQNSSLSLSGNREEKMRKLLQEVNNDIKKPAFINGDDDSSECSCDECQHEFKTVTAELLFSNPFDLTYFSSDEAEPSDAYEIYFQELKAENARQRMHELRQEESQTLHARRASLPLSDLSMFIHDPSHLPSSCTPQDELMSQTTELLSYSNQDRLEKMTLEPSPSSLTKSVLSHQSTPAEFVVPIGYKRKRKISSLIGPMHQQNVERLLEEWE